MRRANSILDGQNHLFSQGRALLCAFHAFANKSRITLSVARSRARQAEPPRRSQHVGRSGPTPRLRDSA